jgi:hypothetical protein
VPQVRQAPFEGLFLFDQNIKQSKGGKP